MHDTGSRLATLDRDLSELLALLTTNGVEFLVVGGHAVAFHGYPRFTQDLDLFVGSDEGNAQRIVRALHEFGFGGLGLSASDFQVDDRTVQIGVSPNRVDILTRLYGVDFKSAWSHRVETLAGQTHVSVISLDDLMANKRATGREQDLADLAVLEKLRAR
ncbi:MAG: nucleotidyltransferase [Gemmatimonadota bacterium]